MPDTTTRTLGYTELRERMQRVLAERGDEGLDWPDFEINPPPYFQEDGEPLTLLGHVLAGLGVGAEQVKDVAVYNDQHPEDMFPAAGFALTSAAADAADTVWMLEMRGVWWSDCIERSTWSELGDRVPEDLVSLTETEATDPRRELDQDELDALGVDGMRLQAELGRNVTAADVTKLNTSKQKLAPVDVTAITATIPAELPDGLSAAAPFVVGYQLWMEAAEQQGEGAAWAVTESTFDVSSTPVDADESDDNVCAAILVDGTWYVVVRDGDTVRARLG